jgi:hypothetical protein
MHLSAGFPQNSGSLMSCCFRIFSKTFENQPPSQKTRWFKLGRSFLYNSVQANLLLWSNHLICNHFRTRASPGPLFAQYSNIMGMGTNWTDWMIRMISIRKKGRSIIMHKPRNPQISTGDAPLPAAGGMRSGPPLSSAASDKNFFVLCTLFGDMVADRVCELRRSELNRKGDFSCEGCIVDMVLTIEQDAVRARLES